MYIAGELDLSTRDELRRRLSPLTGRIVVDLADVTFIDSSAIGVLIGLQTDSRATVANSASRTLTTCRAERW